MAWGRKKRALGKKVLLQPGQHLGHMKPTVVATKPIARVLPGQTLVKLEVQKHAELPKYVPQKSGTVDRFERGGLYVTTVPMVTKVDEDGTIMANTAVASMVPSAVSQNLPSDLYIKHGTYAVCLGETVRNFRSQVKWREHGRPELVTTGRVRFLIGERVIEPLDLRFFRRIK